MRTLSVKIGLLQFVNKHIESVNVLHKLYYLLSFCFYGYTSEFIIFVIFYYFLVLDLGTFLLRPLFFPSSLYPPLSKQSFRLKTPSWVLH